MLSHLAWSIGEPRQWRAKWDVLLVSTVYLTFTPRTAAKTLHSIPGMLIGGWAGTIKLIVKPGRVVTKNLDWNNPQRSTAHRTRTSAVHHTAFLCFSWYLHMWIIYNHTHLGSLGCLGCLVVASFEGFPRFTCLKLYLNSWLSSRLHWIAVDALLRWHPQICRACGRTILNPSPCQHATESRRTKVDFFLKRGRSVGAKRHGLCQKSHEIAGLGDPKQLHLRTIWAHMNVGCVCNVTLVLRCDMFVNWASRLLQIWQGLKPSCHRRQHHPRSWYQSGHGYIVAGIYGWIRWHLCRECSLLGKARVPPMSTCQRSCVVS